MTLLRGYKFKPAGLVGFSRLARGLTAKECICVLHSLILPPGQLQGQQCCGLVSRGLFGGCWSYKQLLAVP